MASALSTEYLGSRLKIRSYDHDPGATSAVLCSPDGGTTIRYEDMKELRKFSVLAAPAIVGGNGVTKVEIVASATTAFSSVTVIKDSGAVQADALDDFVFLECTAEEIAHLGAAAGVELRYVAARLTNATGTDEVKVIYISQPVREYSGLTATTIA